jgi:hypothetical protein
MPILCKKLIFLQIQGQDEVSVSCNIITQYEDEIFKS